MPTKRCAPPARPGEGTGDATRATSRVAPTASFQLRMTGGEAHFTSFPSLSLGTHLFPKLCFADVPAGGIVEVVPIKSPANPHNARYLEKKRVRMGHSL